MDALDMENVKLKPRPRKPRKSQPLRPIALPSVAQGLEHPPRAGGDYDVALAPAIPPPAIHAPVGLAPAAYEIFDPDYRIIPPEEQAIGEQLSIIVEVKPFVLPGFKTLLGGLKIAYDVHADWEWHQGIERVVLHQEAKRANEIKPDLLRRIITGCCYELMF
ncbi:hypothetical protein TWF192_007102 [Orbilia oligospora]|nr:hypothetical protein TWF192_007102 [Orbilia oligospora]